MNTLSLCSSATVRNQISQTYETTDKFTVLYILIFSVLASSFRDVSINWNLQKQLYWLLEISFENFRQRIQSVYVNFGFVLISDFY
jgi:hypothetical protein